MPKGTCYKCGDPLVNPEAIGMHTDCAEDYYKESADKRNTEFPYVVIDGNGKEIDRFDNHEDAEDLIWALQRVELKK